MKPDFETENVRLFCGDCLEIIPHLCGVDALITDPPYGISYSPSGGGRGAFGKPVFKKFTGPIMGDNKSFDPSPLLYFHTIVMWGANHFADKLPSSAAWLVWDKREAESTLKFSDCEMAWSNANCGARIYRHLWNGVCKASEVGETRIHPTQKPVMLMAWCMERVGVSMGHTVLDPYMGSGTTGIACIRTGRKFIGIEKDPKHFATAVERIKRELQQGILF